ncbi:MAG: CAP domain-containing protein [Desulfobacterota bacterium]|jgi:uncharacterized protein YkwD|nr:CAP domain-containing protein [Thermodesulfobacteriota bacterium]
MAGSATKIAGLLALLLVGLLACAREAVPVVKSAKSAGQDIASPADFERQLVRLINEERGRQRLAPLTFSPLLARVAEHHSRDMARTNFFSHNNPAGQGTEERINRAGYRWRAYGENIGCGQDVPEKIMAAWMKSANHRETILSASYTEIGIGFFQGGECRYYWTGLFGRPR